MKILKNLDRSIVSLMRHGIWSLYPVFGLSDIKYALVTDVYEDGSPKTYWLDTDGNTLDAKGDISVMTIGSRIHIDSNNSLLVTKRGYYL